MQTMLRAVAALGCVLLLASAVCAVDAERYYQANQAYWNGKYTSAIDIYRAILRDNPRTELRSRIYFSIASAYVELDDYEKAAGWYEKLLNEEQPPDELRTDAMFRLGQCWFQMGDFQRCGTVLDELLAKYPVSLVSARASLLLDQARERGYVVGAAAPPRPARPETPERPVQPARPAQPAQPAAPARPEAGRRETPRVAEHVVRPGETLTGIAVAVYGDAGRWLEIAQANGIGAPYTLVVGQRLRMPGAAAPAAPATPMVPATPAVPEQPVVPAVNPATDALVVSLREEVRRLREQQQQLGERLREETQRADQAEGLLRAQQEAAQQQRAGREEAVNAARREAAAQAAELEAELKARDELLARTRAAFDALHLRYQELENLQQRQEQQMASHAQLNESVVRKLKELQQQVDDLTAELARTQAAAAAREAQLTQSSDQRIAALTDALQRAEAERAALQRETTESRLAREQLESRLRQMQETADATQQAVSLVEQGRRLRQDGNLMGAMALYRQALAKDPRAADALNGLAYVYAELGDSLAEAKNLVAAAIEQHPQQKGYYLDTLGWIYFREGNYQQAVRTLAQALPLLPPADRAARAVVSFHLGLAYMKLDMRDKAFFAFIDTVNLAPGSTYATEAQGYLAKL